VAEEHLVDLHQRREPVEESDLLGRQRHPGSLDHVSRREPLLARQQLAVGVASQPEHPLAEPAQALERLRRVRSARANIAADDDRRLVRDLLQHGLQRTQVPVKVVKGRDAHLSRLGNMPHEDVRPRQTRHSKSHGLSRQRRLAWPA
jgi:hypothetical protein